MKKILQVRVHNFKRFTSYHVDLKPDVNVLIGDNETGKSSLLLAIDLVLSGSRTKVENYGLHNLFNADAVSKFLNGQKTIANLPEMFIEVYLDEMNDFNVFGKNNSLDRNFNGLRMTCKPDDRYHEEVRAVLKQSDANFPFEFYSISFTTFADQAYSSHRNYLHHVLIDNSQINNEYAMREYIRSLYRVNVAGSEKHVHQNEYRKYKTQFKQDVLQDINSRLKDYSFAVKSGVKDNLETDLTLMEGDIAIDNKGKGRQCFIKTQFALSKGSEKMDLVLLEEPENHLSHHHMKLLIKSITDAKQIQLFITTHNTMISTRLDLRNSILIHGSASLKPLLLKDLPPIRIVCNNTLNAAMRNHSGAIKIRHTASAAERLKQAHTLMGISKELSREMEGLFNQWAKVRITDNDVKKLIQIAMAPNKEVLENLAEGKLDQLSTHYTNIVGSVYEYALGSPTQQIETTAGTVFGAYNAVTGYFQNMRSFKSDEAKFKSIMDGTAKQRAQTAFNLCRDFATQGGNALIYN